MRTRKREQGFTPIEIMIVIIIIALLAVIAIPTVQRARMASHDTFAKVTLRIISAACESYAAHNNETYPTSITALTAGVSPYLDKDYCTKNPTIEGYTYSCTFGVSGYKIVATPVTPGTSGTKTETISTLGVSTP